MELLQPLMAHQPQQFANFGCKRPFLFADGEWNLSATLQGACWGEKHLEFFSSLDLRPADEGAT